MDLLTPVSSFTSLMAAVKISSPYTQTSMVESLTYICKGIEHLLIQKLSNTPRQQLLLGSSTHLIRVTYRIFPAQQESASSFNLRLMLSFINFQPKTNFGLHRSK